MQRQPESWFARSRRHLNEFNDEANRKIFRIPFWKRLLIALAIIFAAEVFRFVYRFFVILDQITKN